MTHIADVTVIIPAPNKADNIQRLVTEVLATAPVQVIVVDYGSTAAIARLIYHPIQYLSRRYLE